MKSIKSILIPTDFSENADKALDFAIEKFGLDKEFNIIHVYRVPYSGAMVSADIDNLLKNEREDQMLQLLMKYKDRYDDIDIQGYTLQGLLVDEILRFQKNKPSDVIILGTTGASGAIERMLGSNAANVMKNINIPTILIPRSTEIERPIKKILFASDLREVKRYETIHPLTGIARENDASIEILHLTENREDWSEIDREELKLDVVMGDIEHNFNFRKLTTAEDDILEFARDIEADMICVIARKHSFFYKLLHRSVTRQLSMHTTTPMLVLKETE